jgi:plastocyanin
VGGCVSLARGMLAATVHLVPVLAAEKSKVPFYIAGGALVAWALIVSVVIGMRVPSFPRTVAAERTVMAVSVVLVLAAVSMAVVTSGGSTDKVVVTPVTSVGREAASGSGTSSLKEEADPAGQLRYTTAHLSALAGKVTIKFTNSSPVMHNMTIAQGTKVIGVTPTFDGGGSKTLTLDLKPGKYVFYCSVPGHRAAGMEGTLTVQ